MFHHDIVFMCYSSSFSPESNSAISRDQSPPFRSVMLPTTRMINRSIWVHNLIMFVHEKEENEQIRSGRIVIKEIK